MFTHGSLSGEKFEIRLIRFVEPTVTGAPIRLELCHSSMSDTHYTALSYTWGDHKNTAQIYINDDTFSVSRNLYDGLEQLRQNGTQSWLWVDSICIQQSDPEEKTQQVSQMHAIYAQADLVYIWLGLGSDESDRAMDFISRVGPRGLAAGSLDVWSKNIKIRDYISTRSSSGQVDADDNIVGSELAQFILDLLHEQCLNDDTPLGKGVVAGIKDLTRREYWHRVWIIQEISLAKEAMVLCGVKSVSLNIFDATFTAVSYCIRSGARHLTPETYNFGCGLLANFYTIIGLTTRRNYCQRNQIRLADIVFQYSGTPYRPFYSASDPRDIVFALLGIITDKESIGLEIDYKLSLVEVFTAMTRALIHDGDKYPWPFHLDRCVPRRDNPCDLHS